MPFLDTNSHLTTELQKVYIKCHINSESYDRHGIFLTKLRGGQNCLFTMGGFPNEKECSVADWLDPLLPNEFKNNWLYFVLDAFSDKASFLFERPTCTCLLKDLSNRSTLCKVHSMFFQPNITQRISVNLLGISSL